MIVIQDNFLTEKEICKLLDLWDDKLGRFASDAIAFYGIDLKRLDVDISFLHNNAFVKEKIHKLRLQKYNESFEQISDYHGHENTHNYIMFLNDNFEGGELEFENGVTILPKAGSLVYFNNNEKHRVHPCIGNRYIFTALGDYELNIKYKQKEKTHLI